MKQLRMLHGKEVVAIEVRAFPRWVILVRSCSPALGAAYTVGDHHLDLPVRAVPVAGRCYTLLQRLPAWLRRYGRGFLVALVLCRLVRSYWFTRLVTATVEGLVAEVSVSFRKGLVVSTIRIIEDPDEPWGPVLDELPRGWLVTIGRSGYET